MTGPTVSEIESAAITAWPALQVAHDGLWIWRAARGYTHRANSMHCLDPGDGHDALARIARFTELYARHGLPPVFRVTPLTAPEIPMALDTLNWVEQDHSRVLVMPVMTHEWTPRHHTALFDPLDPEWHLTQARMSAYSPAKIEALKLLLATMPCDHRGVLAYDHNGVPAAAVLAIVANGIGIFNNVIARESHRGQGFGRAAMSAALAWARDAGASRAAIQVVAANTPARGLYHSLGFTHDMYGYHYRLPGRTA